MAEAPTAEEEEQPIVEEEQPIVEEEEQHDKVISDEGEVEQIEELEHAEDMASIAHDSQVTDSLNDHELISADINEDDFCETKKERVPSEGIFDFENILTEEPEEVPLEDLFKDSKESLTGRSSEGKEQTEEKKLEEPELSSAQVSLASYRRFIDDNVPDNLLDGLSVQTFDSFADASIASSNPSSVASVQSEETKIDRTLYYGLHALYTNQYLIEKWKNTYLHQKIVDYFKKKKISSVLTIEPSIPKDAQTAYEKLLDEMEDLTERCQIEHDAIDSEIQKLKARKEARTEELDRLFDNLQKKEFDLTNQMAPGGDEATKERATNMVKRLLKRQKQQWELLKDMRLTYFKLKSKYAEKQKAVDDLDRLGSNYRIIDYEQLKNDNRILTDKMEEKDTAILSLQSQCKNASQILAHSREKLGSVNQEIEERNKHLETVSEELCDVMEQVNHLKTTRDNYRRAASKLKMEAGLLMKPQLLRDMEMAYKEVAESRRMLAELKRKYSDMGRDIAGMRRRISSVVGLTGSMASQ